jgi:hypothetical protein
MRQPVASLAVAGACVGVVSCYALLTYDGAVGPAADASAPAEASPSPEAGSPSEASLDSAVDGPQDAAYPPGSWCADNAAPGLVLCDDFDEGMLGARWTTTMWPFPSAPGFSSVASSPPRSFSLMFPAIASMPCSTCVIEALSETTRPVSHVTLGFDVQVVTYPQTDGGDGSLYIVAFTQGPGMPRSSVGLQIHPGSVQVAEQLFYGVDAGSAPPVYNDGPSVPIPSGSGWSRIVLDCDFTASAPKATLALGTADSVVPPSPGVSFALTPGPWWGAVPTTLLLGATYVTAGPAFTVLYDNVTLAAQ